MTFRLVLFIVFDTTRNFLVFEKKSKISGNGENNNS